MKHRIVSILWLAASATNSGAAANAANVANPAAPVNATTATMGKRDPFARPAAPPPIPLAADGSPVPVIPEWQPQLRAIVFDGPRSLVNISGVILEPGQSIRGYRLVGVDETGVVLVRAGKTTRLKLDNQIINQDAL